MATAYATHAITHAPWMRRALILARRGAGFVNPNPMVGAVLVNRGRLIASSYHARFGGPHAEQRLLKNLTVRCTPAQLRSATLYLTLEPCHRFGKTPPCVPLIITSGIRHVIIGSHDPNPNERGRSIRALRRRGITVNVGIERKQCDELIRTYAKWIQTQKPYVLAKVGMSLDGKITPKPAHYYITNPASLQRAHELRQECSCLMVGANTIIHDNPKLDTRLPGRRLHHPIKIILDSRLRTPTTSRCLDERTIIACLPTASDHRKRQLLKTGASILEIPPSRVHGKLLFDHIDIETLLAELGQQGMSSILLEGGSFLFTTFINARAIDEFAIFIAAELYGATHLPFTYALKYSVTLKHPRMEQIDDNVFIRGYATYSTIPNYS